MVDAKSLQVNVSANSSAIQVVFAGVEPLVFEATDVLEIGFLLIRSALAQLCKYYPDSIDDYVALVQRAILDTVKAPEVIPEVAPSNLH